MLRATAFSQQQTQTHSVYKEANDEALEASADQTLQRVPVNAHLSPRNLIFSGPRIKFEDE